MEDSEVNVLRVNTTMIIRENEKLLNEDVVDGYVNKKSHHTINFINQIIIFFYYLLYYFFTLYIFNYMGSTRSATHS